MNTLIFILFFLLNSQPLGLLNDSNRLQVNKRELSFTPVLASSSSDKKKRPKAKNRVYEFQAYKALWDPARKLSSYEATDIAWIKLSDYERVEWFDSSKKYFCHLNYAFSSGLSYVKFF